MKNIDKNLLEQAHDWESSKRLSLQKSLKISWVFVGLFSFISLMLAIALMVLMPLKKVQLEIVKVDTSTGIVEVMEQQKDFKTNYDETINTYFLKKYIRYRDGYSYPLMTDFYKNVSLLSTPDEQQNYAKWFNPANENSPLNLYGNKKVAEIKFKSTAFLNDDVAHIRFIRTIKQADSVIREEHLTATVRFKYVKGAISLENKEVNPLGFQVIEYRIDEESVKK